MNYSQMQQIADDHKLGNIQWESKIAINTGRPLEVGYVFVNGQRQLFCKKPSSNQEFYLCNEFRDIASRTEIIKVHIDYSDGAYSAKQLSDDEVNALDGKGYCIVSVPKNKFLEWEIFLNNQKEWHSYWKELDNSWYKENFPEIL